MFVNKENIENKNGTGFSNQGSAFFQPKQAIKQPGDVYRCEAGMMSESGTQTPRENYFFKPQTPAGHIVQRIPAPGKTDPAAAQPAANQTKTTSTSPSHRQIPEGAISRAEFEAYVMNNFGVKDVHNGTKTEQESSLTGQNSKLPTIPDWAEWSPGASSEDYSFIIKAIEDVAKTFMAIPNINIIKFYRVHYETNAASIGVAKPDAGAAFGAGTLTIYQAFGGNRAFPIARSNAQGNYPPVVATLSGPGSSPGAPRPPQGRGNNIEENIVHELGHGIENAAKAVDPKAMDKFNTNVGWIGGASPVLYDVGQPSVKTAVTNNTAPPAQYKIEPSNWNDPKWIEQPMSNYSVDAGPSEDFAESIAAFVYKKDVLKARSPKRFEFIANGMQSWTTQMKLMPPILPPAEKGDFEPNNQMKHTA